MSDDHDAVVMLCRTRLPGPAFQVALAIHLGHSLRADILTATGLDAGSADEMVAYLDGRNMLCVAGEGYVLAEPGAWTEPPQKDEHSDLFNAAWKLYPKRLGNNPKTAAWKAWRARVREGVSELDLLAATKGYARHCEATRSVGTPYVMTGQTFYGPNRPYDQEWGDHGSDDGGNREWDRSDFNPHVPRFTTPLNF
jgi:hypothetical protein